MKRKREGAELETGHSTTPSIAKTAQTQTPTDSKLANQLDQLFTWLNTLDEMVWDLEDCYARSCWPNEIPREQGCLLLAEIFLQFYFLVRNNDTVSNFIYLKELSTTNQTLNVIRHYYVDVKLANKFIALSAVFRKIKDYITQPTQPLHQQLILSYLQRQYNFYKNQRFVKYTWSWSPSDPVPPANLDIPEQLPPEPLVNLYQEKPLSLLLKPNSLFQCLIKHSVYSTEDAFNSFVSFYLLKTETTPENIMRAITFSFVGREITPSVQQALVSELIKFLQSPLPSPLDNALADFISRHPNVKASIFSPGVLVKQEIESPLADGKSTPFAEDISSLDGSTQFIKKIKIDLLQQIEVLKAISKTPWTNNCSLLCTVLIYYINFAQLPPEDKIDIDRPAKCEDYELEINYSPIVKTEKEEKENKKQGVSAKTAKQSIHGYLIHRNALLNTAIDRGIPVREDFLVQKDPKTKALVIDPTKPVLLVDGIEDAASAQERIAVKALETTLKQYAQTSSTGFFTTIIAMCHVLQPEQRDKVRHTIIALATAHHVLYCDAQKFTPTDPQKTFTEAFKPTDFIGNRRTIKPGEDRFGNFVFLDPTGFTYKKFENPSTSKGLTSCVAVFGGSASGQRIQQSSSSSSSSSLTY